MNRLAGVAAGILALALVGGCTGGTAVPSAGREGSGFASPQATPGSPVASAPEASAPVPTPTPQPSGSGALAAGPLDGRTFLSTTVTEAGSTKPLVTGTRITLTFAGGRVTASAGCNTMSGPYRVDGGQFRAFDLAMTTIGCAKELLAQDTWLADFLAASSAVSVTDSSLSLEHGATAVSFADRRIAQPDLPLVGTTWTVDSVIDGSSAAGYAGVTATLRFGADGTILVNAGCNGGSGAYTVDAAAHTLRVTNLLLTKRPCTSPAAELEAGVLAVVGTSPISYTITSDRLALQVGTRGLTLIGTPAG